MRQYLQKIDIKKIQAFVQSHFMPISIGLGVVVIALGGFLFYRFSQPVEQAVVVAEPEPIGERVYDKAPKYSFAAIVENHPVARPLSGIDESSLVFEFLVEGRITRLLSFYEEGKDVSRIGPIRSARPYFVDVIKAYEVPIAHVGGSPAALEELRANRFLDIDEYFNDRYFKRDKSLDAPHNVYSSTSKLAAHPNVTSAREISFGQYYTPTELDDVGEVLEIDVAYATPAFNATWTYSDGRYERTQHKYNEGQDIKTDNVLMLISNSEVIDDVGRLRIDLTKGGVCTLFSYGYAHECEWGFDKKNGFELRDKLGQQLELVTGDTWVHVLDTKSEVSF